MKFGFRWHLSIVYGWPHCCCFDGAIFSFGYCVNATKASLSTPRPKIPLPPAWMEYWTFVFMQIGGGLKTVFTIKSLRCYRSLTKSTVKDYPLTIRVDDIFPGIIICLCFLFGRNAFGLGQVKSGTFRVRNEGLFGLLYLFKSI